MGSTQPMWVGLDLCDGLGWVKFFWPTMVGWVKKSPQPDPIRPMHTLTSSGGATHKGGGPRPPQSLKKLFYSIYIIYILKNVAYKNWNCPPILSHFNGAFKRKRN